MRAKLLILFFLLLLPGFVLAVTETDNGNNPQTKGVCTDQFGPHTDECLGKYLKEWYNDGSQCSRVYILCLDYCLDGACPDIVKTTTTESISAEIVPDELIQSPFLEDSGELNPSLTNEFAEPKGYNVEPTIGRPIYRQTAQTSAPAQAQKSGGYIVEFEGEPVLTYAKDFPSFFPMNILKGTMVNSQKKKILAQHVSFKQMASEYIDEDKIGNEYTKVFNGMAVNVSETAIEKIKQMPNVKTVHPNTKVQAFLQKSVPMIKAPNVWAQGIKGEGTVIAVIDTGVDYTHPDLGGCFGLGCKVIGGYDFVNKDSDPMDDHGHGTHCAATAAGKGDYDKDNAADPGEFWGVAPEAKILAYKVLDESGQGWDSEVIGAIERAVDPNDDSNPSDHADVISMSIGGYGNPDDPMSVAVDNAVKLGVVAVVAAGNSGDEGENTIGSPGTSREAITVAAVEKSGYIASFSSRGPTYWDANGTELSLMKPDVAAPGVNICAAEWDSFAASNKCIDNKHISISGTSMATPHVAGVAALVLQKHPDWSPREVKMALRETATPMGDWNEYGRGIVNALGAVSLNSPPPFAQLVPIAEMQGVEDINGEASGTGIKYTIEIGDGKNPNSWTKILDQSGVSIGILAKGFNTLEYSDGWKTLRLTVKDSGGDVAVDYAFVEINNVKITFPTVWDILSSGVRKIKGVANTHNFGYYTLRLDGDGISQLLKSSKTPVISEGELGELNLDSISVYGMYNLVLEVFDKKGSLRGNYHMQISIDPWLHPGFPVYVFGGDWEWTHAPLLFDLDSDGKEEIITSEFNTTWVIRDGGQEEVFLEVEGVFGSYPPAVGDLNGDGVKELIVQFNTLREDANGDSQFWCQAYALKQNGQKLLGPIGVKGTCWGLAVADINLDKKDEILVSVSSDLGPPWRGVLHVLDGAGKELLGWPVTRILGYDDFSIPSPSAPAIGSVPGVGKLIAIFFDKLYVLKANGVVASGWPKAIKAVKEEFENPSGASLVWADIDGKAGDELVFLEEGRDLVHVWNYKGVEMPGFPVNTTRVGLDYKGCSYNISFGPGIWDSLITVADVNLDGKNEILLPGDTEYYFSDVSCRNNTVPGALFVINNKGEVVVQSNLAGSPICPPLVGDVNGDGRMEIVTIRKAGGLAEEFSDKFYPRTNNRIAVLDDKGNLLADYSGNPFDQPLDMALGDIDGDGKAELVGRGLIHSNLFAWDFPGGGQLQWPLFCRDVGNTCSALPVGSTLTTTTTVIPTTTTSIPGVGCPGDITYCLGICDKELCGDGDYCNGFYQGCDEDSCTEEGCFGCGKKIACCSIGDYCDCTSECPVGAKCLNKICVGSVTTTTIPIPTTVLTTTTSTPPTTTSLATTTAPTSTTSQITTTSTPSTTTIVTTIPSSTTSIPSGACPAELKWCSGACTKAYCGDGQYCDGFYKGCTGNGCPSSGCAGCGEKLTCCVIGDKCDCDSECPSGVKCANKVCGGVSPTTVPSTTVFTTTIPPTTIPTTTIQSTTVKTTTVPITSIPTTTILPSKPCPSELSWCSSKCLKSYCGDGKYCDGFYNGCVDKACPTGGCSGCGEKVSCCVVGDKCDCDSECADGVKCVNKVCGGVSPTTVLTTTTITSTTIPTTTAPTTTIISSCPNELSWCSALCSKSYCGDGKYCDGFFKGCAGKACPIGGCSGCGEKVSCCVVGDKCDCSSECPTGSSCVNKVCA